MQVFVRDPDAMIAAPVQGDVDGIPKGPHYVRILWYRAANGPGLSCGDSEEYAHPAFRRCRAAVSCRRLLGKMHLMRGRLLCYHLEFCGIPDARVCSMLHKDRDL